MTWPRNSCAVWSNTEVTEGAACTHRVIVDGLTSAFLAASAAFIAPPLRCATAWHERNRLSSRRCRALLGFIDRDPTDLALADLGKYGMGTERSFGDWQEYSGFHYKAGTLDADGGGEDRAGIVSHGATDGSIEAGGDSERSAKALLADGWTVPYVAVSDPPKIWSERQVHVRRSSGGGRGMWEGLWE